MKSYRLDQLRGAWGAGFAAAEKKIQSNSTLVGRYFHTLDGGKIEKQGRILSQHDNGMYEVQLFSWISGDPTVRQLVQLSSMGDWLFYDSHADWLAAGDSATSTELQP